MFLLSYEFNLLLVFFNDIKYNKLFCTIVQCDREQIKKIRPTQKKVLYNAHSAQKDVRALLSSSWILKLNNKKKKKGETKS